MVRKFHIYHEPGRVRLVEMCGGMPSCGNDVRGVLSVAKTLRGLFPAIKKLDSMLVWDGFCISPWPPRKAIQDSKPLTLRELGVLRKFCAGL